MMDKEGELHSNAHGVGVVTAGDPDREAIDHPVITEEYFAAVICLEVALSEGLDPCEGRHGRERYCAACPYPRDE